MDRDQEVEKKILLFLCHTIIQKKNSIHICINKYKKYKEHDARKIVLVENILLHGHQELARFARERIGGRGDNTEGGH